MAKLRPFIDFDKIHSMDIPIKEGEQYRVAKKLFEKDSSIKYFYYFNDDAVKYNRFYTYPITREGVESHFKYNNH